MNLPKGKNIRDGPLKLFTRILKDVGGQLVLEGLQRCLAYCSLRELVPQDNSSREEALLIGGVRSPDLVEARVVASSHASLWVR